MKKYLVLTEVIEDATGKVVKYSLGEHRDSRTCATCKWADPKHPGDTAGDRVGASLECVRECDEKNPPPFTTYTGPLFVAPTHGCTEWEGK